MGVCTRLRDLDDVAAELGRAVGMEIRYVPVTVDEYAAGAADQGVPEELIGFLTYLFSEVFGHNADTADGTFLVRVVGYG